jgi:predicted alpha/beta-fold hydrolase
LSGRLHEQAQADAGVVVVHGLGGDAGSHYCLRAADAAHARGWSCLRLNLRGADRSGQDLYHAGLTDDVEAALESLALDSRHRRLFVVGYSLGGHVALRVARESAQSRLAAVVAICAPLDLTLGSGVLDAGGSWLYRRTILRSLKDAYACYAACHPEALSAERVSRVTRMRDFDSLTVVPRFGFVDVDAYYQTMSVGPHLAELRRPTLLVHARHDPLVPTATLTGHLARRSKWVHTWCIEAGGHVGFPPRVSVEGGAPARVEAQVMAWLDRQPGPVLLPR